MFVIRQSLKLRTTDITRFKQAVTVVARFSSKQSTNVYVNNLKPDEFKYLVESVGRRLRKDHPLKPSAIAAEADANNDGVVTIEELSAWWRRRGPTLMMMTAGKTGPPNSSQLRRLGLLAAVPCFTFGFMDNSIMLVSGEALEASIGLKFGISAMACAAMGNIVSDVIGQASGGTVSNLLRPILPKPTVSPQQLKTRSARMATLVGGVIGIFLGCSLGSFPLLFYDEKIIIRVVKLVLLNLCCFANS